ncbi:hypothetical protein ACFFX0_04335 [Citricoccus parietis]|uniref:Uncharacterized protein n=1 Tax=Citricoccus parietis TaxID=592307 RepID=A0ABV5FUV1_9MICC
MQARIGGREPARPGPRQPPTAAAGTTRAAHRLRRLGGRARRAGLACRRTRGGPLVPRGAAGRGRVLPRGPAAAASGGR